MRLCLLCLAIVLLAVQNDPVHSALVISDVVKREKAAVEKPAVTRYWQGIDALANGEIESAEKIFKESLRLDPSWHGPLLGLADAAIRAGRPEDGQLWLARAEATAPRSVEVLTARGRFHFLQGELEKAEAAYKKAIAVDEQAFLPRLDLADLYLSALWKPRDAVDAYRAVLRMNPDHPGGHYGLGVALMATGQADEAMTALNNALALAPDNPLSSLALGRLHYSRGEFGKAVDSFNRALEARPDFAIVRIDRGDALAAMGDVNAAVADYEAAAKAAPKLSIAHFKLGSIYQLLQRPDDAETAYLKAIETDPANARALNNLAWLAAERKERLDDALRWAIRAIELAPDEVAFQDTLGWVRRARGELDEAAKVFEAAAANSDLADIPYRLGIVYSEQGRKREAVAAFKKALEIDNNFANAADAESRIDALSGG